MNKLEETVLKESIISRLQTVIDPETGADVIRMQLVLNLTVDDGGVVSYTFRPSSPVCPIAVYLAKEIKKAVAEVPGVEKQNITVIDYVAAEQLTELINREGE
jgi:metal-sulfur cluster biosynthetic enzyme